MSPRRTARIRDALRGVYGRPVVRPHGRWLDELVLTILSQSTSDAHRDVAFLALRHRFGDWAAVRDAPVAAVQDAIRPGGLHRVKAPRIQAILGGAEGLGRGPAGTVSRAELLALPGVGRKTAACVGLFAFGAREVPVDTHVARVGARLGLLPGRGSPDLLHDRALAITPRGSEWEVHLNLLRHGRRLCTARRPACPVCPLRRTCPSAQVPSPPLAGGKDLL